MIDALGIGTVVLIGLMVGVELSVAFVVNRILDALPDEATLLGRAHGGRMLGALMPFWYLGSVALSAIWAVAAWGEPGTGLVVTAAALLVASVVMSLALLVPINNRAKTWTAENRPADWEEQSGRWDRYHYVRVAVIVAAFTLVTAALAAG
ncbi:anthrone oxygenase family protein [Nocardia sp. NPDC057353]|uniref:anthrone oxygenase family protein n=1 Tax=Nocardia sp. NPDC057353 TaxID=3346104 RepID=UPI00363CD6DC